jgi:hypothetical protein
MEESAVKVDDEIQLSFGFLKVSARGRWAIKVVAIPLALLLIAIALRVAGFTF